MAVRNSVSGLYDDAYAVNDLEEGATTYIGKAVSPLGLWVIQRYVEATGAFDYANRSINPTVSTYGAAWTGRGGLTYQRYEQLTGL